MDNVDIERNMLEADINMRRMEYGEKLKAIETKKNKLIEEFGMRKYEFEQRLKVLLDRQNKLKEVLEKYNVTSED